jgi:hypothetical protein
LEDELESAENFEREPGKLRSTMVYRRSGQSTENPIRHVRRTGDLQKVTSALIGQDRLFC